MRIIITPVAAHVYAVAWGSADVPHMQAASSAHCAWEPPVTLSLSSRLCLPHVGHAYVVPNPQGLNLKSFQVPRRVRSIRVATRVERLQATFPREGLCLPKHAKTHPKLPLTVGVHRAKCRAGLSERGANCRGLVKNLRILRRMVSATTSTGAWTT